MKSKLDELKSLTKSLVLRVREVDLRPQKIRELKDTLNTTEQFLQGTRLMFFKKDDDEKPFTDSELTSFEKLIQETTVSSLDCLSNVEHQRHFCLFNPSRHGVIKCW